MEWLRNGIQAVLDYFRYVELSSLISSVLDIAIITAVVYAVITFIVRSGFQTRSGSVLKGILVVVIVVVIAQVFHLYTVNFFLNNVLEIGLLGLLILFQPELRQLLERVGHLGDVLQSDEAPEDLDMAIRHTVEAFTSMSKDRVGALMVFERKNRLDEQIATGSALDCSVDVELLKNLFWNKAPLHDGAVIVRGGRIVGAGCMLPMSSNPNLSRDLGMRHRAGIGMSEQSDAVVAIVSEETGSISVAVEGKIKRHLAPDTLESMLRNELIPETGKRDSARSRLTGLLRTRKGDSGDEAS